MELDHELFMFIFYHMFFPPKLPQSEEENLWELESKLVLVVRDHLREFINALSVSERKPWNTALRMLDTWVKITSGNSISAFSLADALFRLPSTGK